MPDSSTPDAEAQPTRAPTVPAPIDTRDLFGEARELMINHDGALYRLRITRNHKLILTK